jgi:general secretion pathway protein D
LIRETIEPESWDDVGGPGSMEPFPLNLSLIISQTEEVHDRIASLLEQLRRLLDLQLAVEVRFITLTDNFFERIGIDFDFDIDDDQDKPFQVFGQPNPAFTPNYNFPSTQDPEADNPGRDYQDRDHLNGVAVGQSAPGIFSVDLDIPFRQNSFSLGVPTFGGFTNDAGAQIGFAILSDIEAFFFINAAQADRRTNVVQAPKVVMFNGQTGIVFDFVARPFLIGVIPIIGSGSVGFTPIIQPIPSGAIVAVTGIISADRRYVRLSVFPFFFQLGEVFTFTTNLGAVGGGGGLVGGGGAATTIPVTIQLPVVAFTSVFTTVNVPDGGTVLLGGVKRVNEGRTEAGVPVLNKLPYVNRLFKNVGTGRETQSLMLMVTPRIIIGEEEEELLGI